MANFCRLTSISVTHDYFADGLCRVLEFIPTPATKKLLERNQLLAKPIDGGFCVIGDQDVNFLLDNNLVLRFYARINDPYFSFYTEGMPATGGPAGGMPKNSASLFFTTEHRQQNELIASAYYESSPELEDEMSSGLINSLIFVDVHLAPDCLKQGISENFAIRFAARALHWKYYFFGDLAAYDLEIQDLAAQASIMFTNSNAPVVKNGKALLSHAPIVLSEVPKQRFQLKDKNNSGKVLVKRLPNAGVNRIGKERNTDGQSFLVAEIYINQ